MAKIDLTDLEQIRTSCPVCLGRVQNCNHCGNTGRVSFNSDAEWLSARRRVITDEQRRQMDMRLGQLAVVAYLTDELYQ